MVDIYQQVFDKVKTDLLSLSEYEPLIVKTAPSATSKFPLVEIVESQNVLQYETLDKKEQLDRLTYTINVYAQDNKNKVSKVVIAEELVAIIDDVMSDYFGMDRTNCQRIPNLDTNVYRMLLTYNCSVDKDKLIIYRRR